MADRCPRHSHCAYTSDEEDRCWFCHTTYKAIEACTAPCCRGDVWHHLLQHEHADEKAAAATARRRPHRS